MMLAWEISEAYTNLIKMNLLKFIYFLSFFKKLRSDNNKLLRKYKLILNVWNVYWYVYADLN